MSMIFVSLLLASAHITSGTSACSADGNAAAEACDELDENHNFYLLQTTVSKNAANQNSQMDSPVIPQPGLGDGKGKRNTDIIPWIGVFLNGIKRTKIAEFLQLGNDSPKARQNPEPSADDLAEEATGVTGNAEGDLGAFVSATILNSFTILFCFGAFMMLKRWYPIIYEHNVITEVAPKLPGGWFGWAKGAWSVTTEEAIRVAGLDNGLQIEFIDFCIRVLFIVAVPLMVIMSFLNYFCGGGRVDPETGLVVTDSLSKIAMGNVRNGHPWLYWINGFIVLAVCILVKNQVFAAQTRFMRLRIAWLKDQSPDVAHTVLVEGIPDEYRCDKAVYEFFAKMFPPERIKSVHVVKNTGALASLTSQKEDAEQYKKGAELQWEKDGKKEDSRPMVREHFIGAKVDAIKFYSERIASLEQSIKEEQARVMKESAQVGGVNTSCAFVTFTRRRERELALRMRYGSMRSEWVISMPPEPSTVIWADLTGNPEVAAVRRNMGLILVAGLYLAFLPVCVFVTNVCNLVTFPDPIQSFWLAYAPTLGLLLFLSFLPTVLLIIFRLFFNLKSDAWSQQQLQIYYFWFQVIFVILVTAIGSSFITAIGDIAQDPWSIFRRLADEMPTATHFYQNFMVMQAVTHSMNLMRYVQLGKFIMFRTLWGDEEGKKMAEPEDQDYYGLGARTGRWAINMAIGLIFSTLSPLCGIMALYNFLVQRLCYGYLIVYAETRKPDLGGAFWVTLMEHVLKGMVIYCVLMIGVLCFRAANYGPMIVAIIALCYTLLSIQKFKADFDWESLPFNEITDLTEVKAQDLEDAYLQPELRDLGKKK